MSPLMRLVANGLAAVLTVTLLVQPAVAQNGAQPFGPPPGVTLAAANTQASALEARAKRYKLDPMYERQVVRVRTEERPGTIVVDTGRRFLYLILGDGKALRYGIGVAREGFEWSGTHKITNKREWPGWTPPAAMLKRQPHLPRYMPGGPDNPLGARALYIGSTLYRIHGTNEPWTIGGNVSSGCIRMVNDDVVDLFERVKVGAKVIVL